VAGSGVRGAAPGPPTDTILSVSALTRLVKDSLEGSFPALWVRGEVSGCRRPESGHLYFSLKEGTAALIECVVWRTSAIRLGFEPRDGTEVEAFGGVTVYEPRGRYQLVVKELRPSGLGALLLALEELKRRLGAEGLFDPARKRPLPRYPRRIGIVTSPVGAAVRDLVKVLRERWPSIEVVLAPARVQGPGAAAEIVAAIRRFDRYDRIDLLIVARGGGSLEDLWAFNEEVVVRAIAGARRPVISAVGHEVDWTLADLAADCRAATPSNAAEIAVRERAEVARGVERLGDRLTAAVRRRLDDHRRTLQAIVEKYGFRRQRDALGFLQQRVDDLAGRLGAAAGARLATARARLQQAQQRYGLREWPRSLAERATRLEDLERRLAGGWARGAHARRTRFAACDGRLRALSPRRVLERGYCLARHPDGRLVRAAAELTVGQRLGLEFARGEAGARIEDVRPGRNDGE
jgi:exodeoxyribonuclease VII large subunit